MVTPIIMLSSTGGTIQGVGKNLRDKKSNVTVVLSNPEKSRLHGLFLNRIEGETQSKQVLADVADKIKAMGGVKVKGARKESLTGIMLTNNVTFEHIDYSISINDFDTFDECRSIASAGLLVSGSAGLNVVASKVLSSDIVQKSINDVDTILECGITIVTLLCDHGIRYLSKIFNDEWKQANDTRTK